MIILVNLYAFSKQSILCRPQRVLKRSCHWHEALKSESKIVNVDAISFAFAIARDGGTWSLKRRMLSIHMYNFYSSSNNCLTEALKVICLVSSENKADCPRMKSCLFHIFVTTASLISYSRAKARLLWGFSFLSFEMISYRWDSLRRLAFDVLTLELYRCT